MRELVGRGESNHNPVDVKLFEKGKYLKRGRGYKN